ncbi:hypothetical protein ABZ352_18520 [Streptomyces griseofuscus]|uniref:hypothetical protein n=1 Tax=Streptomyces griseofuscus TaxID=146922 RepID=UPI0033E1ED9B
MILGRATVSVAPPGTAPDDTAAWTPIGFADEEPFELAADPGPAFPVLPPAVATVAVPAGALHCLLVTEPWMRPQCLAARAAIEKHAAHERVRALPAIPPCPPA